MKFLKILLVIFLFVFGLIIGFSVKNYPLIEFNKEIKIYEILNLLLTASIGVCIPFFIKRWIEDNRHIKNGLISELDSTFEEIKNIKNKVKTCFFNKSISPDDKQEINIYFEDADLKISCLEEQLIQSYKNETKELRDEIKNEYINYWKFTTCAELMSKNFIAINENFYRAHNENFTRLETKIKQAKNKVHRL